MCLLFLYCDPNLIGKGYKLIIANNRDEILERPTAPATFLSDFPDVLCPLDLERGSGGTWIGVNRNGRIGSLLNILTPDSDIDLSAQGRGHLVYDYLVGNEDGYKYIEDFSRNGRKYNYFHFIGVDLGKSSSDTSITYFTNHEKSEEYREPVRLELGFHSFCNSYSRSKPWNKCLAGLGEFKKIVEGEAGHYTDHHRLADQLVNVLQNPSQHPDDKILTQATHWTEDDFYQRYCAVNVQTYKYGYGTRTHTVILVDEQDNLYYTEKYISEFDATNSEVKWETNRYEMKLSLS